MDVTSSQDVINDFSKDYQAELQQHCKCPAETVCDICRKSLNIQGIFAVTTCREKSYKSSQEKLERFGGVTRFGDILLDQLHNKHMSRRTSLKDSFTNKFALAMFLSGRIPPNPDKKDVNIGPVDALLKVLRIFKLDNPVALEMELDNMEVKSVEERFKPLELGVSTYVIDHILLTKGPSTISVEDTKARYGEYGYKLRVMISVIMWLDEFFLPLLGWEEKFSSQPRDGNQQKSLLWLMESVRLPTLLLEGSSPSPKEEFMIDCLWEWFEGHEEAVVQFALRVAKIGVLKDLPEELPLFARVRSSVKDLLFYSGL